MSKEERYLYKCDKCGVETPTSVIVGWKFLTQPLQTFCPDCSNTKDNELNRDRESIQDVTWEGKLVSGYQYDADYFLHGKVMGKSLYSNYRWLPDLTIPMAATMVAHLDIEPDDQILDFGCARGYLVRALRYLGYNAWGYDISQWALENADPVAKEYLICNDSAMLAKSFDWVIAKDVLEHVSNLDYTVDGLMDMASKGVFAVVPLFHDGRKYDVSEYELDVTHIHRRPLQWWVGQFHRPGWSVEARYRVPGIKGNYSQFPTGNGFVTCRRLGENL